MHITVCLTYLAHVRGPSDMWFMFFAASAVKCWTEILSQQEDPVSCTSFIWSIQPCKDSGINKVLSNMLYIVVMCIWITQCTQCSYAFNFIVCNFSAVMADLRTRGRPDSTVSASLSKSGQLAVASLCTSCHFLQSDHNMGAGHTGTALLGIQRHISLYHKTKKQISLSFLPNTIIKVSAPTVTANQ